MIAGFISFSALYKQSGFAMFQFFHNLLPEFQYPNVHPTQLQIAARRKSLVPGCVGYHVLVLDFRPRYREELFISFKMVCSISVPAMGQSFVP